MTAVLPRPGTTEPVAFDVAIQDESRAHPRCLMLAEGILLVGLALQLEKIIPR